MEKIEIRVIHVKRELPRFINLIRPDGTVYLPVEIMGFTAGGSDPNTGEFWGLAMCKSRISSKNIPHTIHAPFSIWPGDEDE